MVRASAGEELQQPAALRAPEGVAGGLNHGEGDHGRATSQGGVSSEGVGCRVKDLRSSVCRSQLLSLPREGG